MTRCRSSSNAAGSLREHDTLSLGTIAGNLFISRQALSRVYRADASCPAVRLRDLSHAYCLCTRTVERQGSTRILLVKRRHFGMNEQQTLRLFGWIIGSIVFGTFVLGAAAMPY